MANFNFKSKVFGHDHPNWDRIETPVGDICYHCQEPIAAEDIGFLIPYGGTSEWRMTAIHRECFLRDVFGSVGHQTGKCSCHGGDEEDPPEMTVREAAKAAVKCWEQLQTTELDDEPNP